MTFLSTKGPLYYLYKQNWACKSQFTLKSLIVYQLGDYLIILRMGDMDGQNIATKNSRFDKGQIWQKADLPRKKKNFTGIKGLKPFCLKTN